MPTSQVGDAYIATTGALPGESRTLQENALALAKFAIEVQEACSSIPLPNGSGQCVVNRVGLHCGPLVAAILPTHRPRYQARGACPCPSPRSSLSVPRLNPEILLS